MLAAEHGETSLEWLSNQLRGGPASAARCRQSWNQDEHEVQARELRRHRTFVAGVRSSAAAAKRPTPRASCTRTTRRLANESSRRATAHAAFSEQDSPSDTS